MPLQTNLFSFLRGKIGQARCRPILPRGCCLNKIHGEKKNKHKMWYQQHIPSPNKQRSCSKAKKNWWRKKRDSNHITYINPKPKRFEKFRGCFCSTWKFSTWWFVSLMTWCTGCEKNCTFKPRFSNGEGHWFNRNFRAFHKTFREPSQKRMEPPSRERIRIG